VSLPVGKWKEPFVRIIGPGSPAREVEEHTSRRRVHRDTSTVALRRLHRDISGQHVDIAPAERRLLAPPEAHVDCQHDGAPESSAGKPGAGNRPAGLCVQ
jgi:hypothetical protein